MKLASIRLERIASAGMAFFLFEQAVASGLPLRSRHDRRKTVGHGLCSG